MEIIFLGTSQAIPTKKRNHTSILLNYKNENILIDCGEGTQRQFRKLKINPCKLTRILITHWHGDHVLGLPGLFQTLELNNYSKILNIYGPKGTKKYIKQIEKLFVHKGKIKMNINEVKGEFLDTENFKIISSELNHNTPCNGYSFIEKDKFKIIKSKLKKLKISKEERKKIKLLTQGKNIKIKNKTINYKDLTTIKKGKKISFILDTKKCNNINKLAKDSDLLIIESTYSNKEKELASEYKHMTAEQAGKIAKQNNVKKLILTHISQRYENKESIILKEAKKYFKNTKIAEDFMKVEI